MEDLPVQANRQLIGSPGASRRLYAKLVGGSGNVRLEHISIYERNETVAVSPAVAIFLPFTPVAYEGFDVVDIRPNSRKFPDEFTDPEWLGGLLGESPRGWTAEVDRDKDGIRARVVKGKPQARLTYLGAAIGFAQRLFVCWDTLVAVEAIYKGIRWAVISGKETEGPTDRVFLLGAVDDLIVCVLRPEYGVERQMTIDAWVKAKAKENEVTAGLTYRADELADTKPKSKRGKKGKK